MLLSHRIIYEFEFESYKKVISIPRPSSAINVSKNGVCCKVCVPDASFVQNQNLETHTPASGFLEAQRDPDGIVYFANCVSFRANTVIIFFAHALPATYKRVRESDEDESASKSAFRFHSHSTTWRRWLLAVECSAISQSEIPFPLARGPWVQLISFAGAHGCWSFWTLTAHQLSQMGAIKIWKFRHSLACSKSAADRLIRAQRGGGAKRQN